LVYDLMEPFRWLGDLTTMQAFESGVLDLKDFYFTGDDYSYKIEIEAKRRFLQLLKGRFNSGISCKGRVLKWDTVIEQKTTELSRFLVDSSQVIDFSKPGPFLKRLDSLNIRHRILSLTQEDASRLGIRKSTLQYLRKKSRRARPFRVRRNTLERLQSAPMEVRK